MGKKRASLDFGDQEKQSDLEALTDSSRRKPTAEQRRLILEAGAELGFKSREPRRGRPSRSRTPYQLAKNIKVRVGMPELIEDIRDYMGAASHQEIFDFAIKALVERLGDQALKADLDAVLGEKGPGL